MQHILVLRTTLSRLLVQIRSISIYPIALNFLYFMTERVSNFKTH